ncbi:hypothetical protein KKD37_02990 [Patescibacteria group bacterium]|nr:hypothetical protein [Patescibacteria group bacterium]
MPDTTPEPNYQDILDKYAASLASTEAPIDSEPQASPVPVEKTEDFPKEPLPTNPEPTVPAPEAVETPTVPETPPVMLQDVDPELKIEANSDTQPLPDLPPVSPSNYEVKFDVPLDDETPSLTSVPKNNNFFKYLFFFSLLIFVGVLVSIVLSLVNSQKSLPLSDSNTPVVDVSPSLPPSYAFCEINDQKYAVNQSFTATDGCNTCTCNSDLTISCTEMACDASNSASIKNYSNPVFNFSFSYPTDLTLVDSLPKQLTTTTIHENLSLENEDKTFLLTLTVGTVYPDGFGPIFSNKDYDLAYQAGKGLTSTIKATNTPDENFDKTKDVYIYSGEIKKDLNLLIMVRSSKSLDTSDKIVDQILSTFKLQ